VKITRVSVWQVQFEDIKGSELADTVAIHQVPPPDFHRMVNWHGRGCLAPDPVIGRCARIGNGFVHPSVRLCFATH